MKKLRLLSITRLTAFLLALLFCIASCGTGSGDTETDSLSETISESTSESISESTPEGEDDPPTVSPAVIRFDGDDRLTIGKNSGCTTAWYEDAERGTVLKTQATKKNSYFVFEYEDYVTSLGLTPIDLDDYPYALVTFKTGAGYGDAHGGAAFALDCASGDNGTPRLPAAIKVSYDAADTTWQTVLFDLASAGYEGTLHRMLLSGVYTEANDYCTIQSLQFVRTPGEAVQIVKGGDPALDDLYKDLPESVIEGVDLSARTAPDEDASVALWFDHISARTPQNDTTSTGRASYLIRMSGNSIEGCQFFLAPEADRTFSLSLTEFSDGQGNTLRTELFYERYFLVEDTMIPDALPPLTGDISVAAGTSQGFYIKVWADADETPGLYTAELQVKDAETGKVIKVATVYTYVWDFSLSEETAMKTSVFIYDHYLFPEYEKYQMTEQTNEEIYKNYYDFLLENRLCAGRLPYSLRDERVWEYINNPRVNTFNIGQNEGDEATAYAILSQHPDVKDKGYYYYVDEPTSQIALDAIKNHGDRLFSTFPDYRMISPFFTNLTVDDNTDQIEFMSEYLTIWNTKVFAFTPREYDFIPGVQYLMNEEQEATYGTFEERMAAEVATGDELWVYYCWEPSLPYVNWLMTGDGTEPIVSVWQCRNTDCTGILYWCVNQWTENMYSVLAGTGVWGDGVLLYSGAEYGMYEPVSSLRLENIRGGIQDYQMLEMVEAMAGAEAADALTSLVSVDVIAYTNDGDHLHAARVLLGERVESLVKETGNN